MGAGLVVVGTSALPATAGASGVNLIQNPSFETIAGSTTSYLTVDAGDSTTISDWTVDTPSVYQGGGGSVDVVSNDYWNTEDGDYSIDLAGTTGVPGGLYQDVATTPGVEYTLSFWSAVNGDETPGNSHTMGVTVNGSTVDTVTALGVGRPLDWVQNTVTFTATSTTSKIEFDDTTPTDQNQGPALDNVSLIAVPDVVSGSPVNPPSHRRWPARQFTVPVATFTDSDTDAMPPSSPPPSTGATALPPARA